MFDIKVIANPLAGRGRGRHTIPIVSRLLEREGVHFSLEETRYAGHAIELARQAIKEKYRTIVALGGDGTVHEIINGIYSDDGKGTVLAEDVRLGIIPAGSGNDFAYAVGVPPDIYRACKRLLNGTTRLVDMGLINGRLFAYGVGIGFDAEVNIESRKIKWLRGMAVYLIALLKVMLSRRKTYQLEIVVDGVQLKERAMMVSIANGRRYAGVFLVTPYAKVDDGLLDLCIISPISRFDMLRFLPLVVKGRHTELSAVKMYSAREIVVKSESPLISHVDGEIFGSGGHEYQFSLVPNRLRVIC